MLRRAQAGYFGLIEQLDDAIAPLIADFRARSEKAGRPWIIVVTSDHGELLGDHGFFRKCEPYEGSANIPMLVAGSSTLAFVRGVRSPQPVCLEDLMPTLLELAGAQLPAPLDGVSLVPLLRGAKQKTRDWLHFEHATCYSEEQGFQALTDGHMKYVWRPKNGREQLFDLNSDPREEHDLSADAAHTATLEKWRTRLVQRLVGRPEGFSDGKRLIAGRPYPPLHK
jgi:arylsulfatase A-like enzyme